MMREFTVTLSTAAQESMNKDFKRWHITSNPIYMASDAPGFVSEATIKLDYDGVIEDEILRRLQLADPGCVVHEIRENIQIYTNPATKEKLA